MSDALQLQAIQVMLQNASATGILFNKQKALDNYLNKIGPMKVIHEHIFTQVAIQHGTSATIEKVNVYTLDNFDTDLHIEAAHHLLNTELAKCSYDTAKYARAEKVLFSPEKPFTTEQMLYTNEKNENLTVDDLVRVTKYSLAFIELMDPDDKNIELASAAATVFHGIQSTLNNQRQPIPISTKLHIANGFLATVIKANIKDTDTKRGITIASTLIDLVIDFFSGK